MQKEIKLSPEVNISSIKLLCADCKKVDLEALNYVAKLSFGSPKRIYERAVIEWGDQWCSHVSTRQVIRNVRTQDCPSKNLK